MAREPGKGTKTPRAGRARAPRSVQAKPAFRRMPVASLRVFVAVAEHRNFTRAADALGVTPSAASMQVQALEDYLRLPLFRRNGRQVELTAEGAALLPRIERALGELERALDEARADRGAGPLRITLLASFLGQWLLPRLPDFSRRHPQIELQLHTSIEIVDFVQTGLHAGIRFGDGHWPHLHTERLFPEWLVPVCTPAQLARHGMVNDAADLARYTLLHGTSEPWTAWLLDSGGGAVWPTGGIAFDDSQTIVRAAEAGQGLALSRWTLVAEEVKRGRLALASRRFVPSDRGYYFVCPPGHLALDKIAAFARWLREQAAAFGPPD
jgi:LysR family transcriptional regulator, glycine cleavage system transcriptional activator